MQIIFNEKLSAINGGSTQPVGYGNNLSSSELATLSYIEYNWTHTSGAAAAGWGQTFMESFFRYAKD